LLLKFDSYIAFINSTYMVYHTESKEDHLEIAQKINRGDSYFLLFWPYRYINDHKYGLQTSRTPSGWGYWSA